MNADKNQLLWLGTHQQLNKLSVNELQLLGARVSCLLSVSNLGVTIDSQLSMSDHLNSLVGLAFSNYVSSGCAVVINHGHDENARTCLHYCNILLYGL